MPHIPMLAEVSVLTLALRLVVSLGIVLGMIAALAWVARKPKGMRFGLGTSSDLTVRHREQLGRASTIALVQVGERTLLLGANEHTIEVLAEGPDLLAPPEPESLDDPTATTAVEDGPGSPATNLLETVREWSVRRS